MASRAQYPQPVKDLVKSKYHYCKSRADREALAWECTLLMRQLAPGEDIPPMTLQKLYNLASRLNATRGNANSLSDHTEDEAVDVYNIREDLSRLDERDDFYGLTWSENDIRILREHWRVSSIEEIAFILNRTEIAVAYKARHLGLRNVPKFWDSIKVAAWLGLPHDRMLKVLPKVGLEVYPCCDPNGEVLIHLVSTMSLARVLLKNRTWKNLVEQHDADLFFIHDLMESVAALQDQAAVWEPTPWVSHGHTSMCPRSIYCFGTFYDGYDTSMSGWDKHPRDLSPSRYDLDSSYLRPGKLPAPTTVPLEAAERRELIAA